MSRVLLSPGLDEASQAPNPSEPPRSIVVALRKHLVVPKHGAERRQTIEIREVRRQLDADAGEQLDQHAEIVGSR